MNDMTQGTIYYTGRERIGKWHMSKLCLNKMEHYHLTPEILDEVFRYGRVIEVTQEKYAQIYKIAYAYEERIVYVIYTEDPVKTGVWRGNLNEVCHILITCWVQRAR